MIAEIQDLSRELYHADQVVGDTPSLSASIASIICARSPAHAREAHPRLNPNFKRKEEKKFDLGTVAHALLLERRDPAEVIRVVYCDNWMTKAAKELAAEAREAGLTPLLEKDAEAVYAMLDAARGQLDAREDEPPLLTDGKPEQTLVWEENGALCRARPDWLRDDGTWIEDVKTVHDANPENWTRRNLFAHGCDVQAAFYLLGAERILGERPRFRWILIEKTPPYPVVVVHPSKDLLTVGEAKALYAIRRWSECLTKGIWPMYVNDPFEADLPAWADDPKWLVDEYVGEAA